MFCDAVLQEPDAPKTILCCGQPSMIIDNGAHICKRCGSIHGYQVVREFVDFYENTYRIKKKKLIYERKYHLENTIQNICNKYKLRINYSNTEKIHQIFQEIGEIPPQINGNRKRMININFILKM